MNPLEFRTSYTVIKFMQPPCIWPELHGVRTLYEQCAIYARASSAAGPTTAGGRVCGGVAGFTSAEKQRAAPFGVPNSRYLSSSSCNRMYPACCSCDLMPCVQVREPAAVSGQLQRRRPR